MPERIRIVLADDHALFAQSLAGWLAGQEQVDVAAVVSDADEALAATAAHKPDVILLDIDMPGLDCFQAARLIAENSADSAVLFVSAHTHDHYIEQALAVEAAGFVTKEEPPESVLAAIHAAAAGGAYFSPAVQSRIIVDAAGARLAKPAQTRLSSLTPRELDTLRYIARGMSKRDIAEVMSVSVKTVDTHTYNLMEKLDIHDRVDLTRFAIREGLTQP